MEEQETCADIEEQQRELRQKLLGEDELDSKMLFLNGIAPALNGVAPALNGIAAAIPPPKDRTYSHHYGGSTLPAHLRIESVNMHVCADFLSLPDLYTKVGIREDPTCQYKAFCLWYRKRILSGAISFDTEFGKSRNSSRKVMCIPFCGTRPGFRRKGLGQALIKYILIQYKQQGIEECFVPAYNTAISFWKRLMFDAVHDNLPPKIRYFSNTTPLRLRIPDIGNLLYAPLPSNSDLRKMTGDAKLFAEFTTATAEETCRNAPEGISYISSTLLHEAMKLGSTKVAWRCAKVLHSKVTFAEKDMHGRTALHYATKHDTPAMLDWLIKQQSDVHVRDKAGQTPLFFAAQRHWAGSVQALLSHDASALEKDFTGATPLSIALQTNSTSEAAHLLRAACEEASTASTDVRQGQLSVPAYGKIGGVAESTYVGAARKFSGPPINIGQSDSDSEPPPSCKKRQRI